MTCGTACGVTFLLGPVWWLAIRQEYGVGNGRIHMRYGFLPEARKVRMLNAGGREHVIVELPTVLVDDEYEIAEARTQELARRKVRLLGEVSRTLDWWWHGFRPRCAPPWSEGDYLHTFNRMEPVSVCNHRELPGCADFKDLVDGQNEWLVLNVLRSMAAVGEGDRA